MSHGPVPVDPRQPARVSARCAETLAGEDVNKDYKET